MNHYQYNAKSQTGQFAFETVVIKKHTIKNVSLM